MFFYHFDLLDDFIQSNFISNLKQEQQTLTSILDLYMERKSNFIMITNHMIELTNSIQEDEIKAFQDQIIRIKKIVRRNRIH